MGSGSWTTCAYDTYTKATYNVSADSISTANFATQDFYRSRSLADVLNAKDKIRECLDSDEHPNSYPIILALDVTGSMGSAATEAGKKLGEIMSSIYANDAITDPEFCVMAIGDLAYDYAPIQMSQFESDVRIAEQLDKVYFEGGGGGNRYESYTMAWYMGLRHAKLDCWNRDAKGLIITLGDEQINPYLPMYGIQNYAGDTVQADVETDILYGEVCEKYDVYHISVDDSRSSYGWNNQQNAVDKSWIKVIGEDHYRTSNLENLADTIIGIITEHAMGRINNSFIIAADTEEVSW